MHKFDCTFVQAHDFINNRKTKTRSLAFLALSKTIKDLCSGDTSNRLTIVGNLYRYV